MKNLIGNLNLNPSVDEGQAIYHSQLYGTFFGVYAFVSSEKTGNDEVRKITSMTLQVVNYKGVLDLGIEKAIYVPKPDGDFTGGEIKLIMRAVINNQLDGTPDKIKTNDVIVEGISGSLFKRGEARINIKRYLKPIHSENSRDDIALKEGLFDSEFHYREGVVIPEYTQRPADTIGGKPAEPESTFALEEAGQAASGLFCPFAELLLFWFP